MPLSVTQFSLRTPSEFGFEAPTNMHATLCDIHLIPIFNFGISVRTRSHSPSYLGFNLRNPTRLRTQLSSLLIDTPEGQVVSNEESPYMDKSQSITRRLILLRHAQSSWENRSLRDHDRPLSKTGQADAVKIAHKLLQLDWIPELILSSDATRSKETLKILQDQVPAFLNARVHFISSFYSIAAMDGQTAEHLQKVISKYSRDEIVTIMCLGHNKGWEEAASMLCGTSVELKTANAALLETIGKSWNEAFVSAGYGGWKLQAILKPS